VMGRKSGFIALNVGLAGGAEQIIVPEIHIDIEDLCQNLRESFKRGKRSSIIVVAEGNAVDDTINIEKYVKMRLKVDTRLCTLGHIQRGGSPTAADRILASCLGIAAVEGLMNGKKGHAVGEVKGEIVYTPFRDTWEKKKTIDERFLKYIPVLSQ
jgi:6-phosphofructokinase 1